MGRPSACLVKRGFEVEFATSPDEHRRGPLSEVWFTPFERVPPVRSFPRFREQRNFTGLYYSATMDAHVGFESWLERDVAMSLDFDPQVVAFASQPFLVVLATGRRGARAYSGFLRPAS